MILIIAVLFITTFLAGYLSTFFPYNPKNLRLPLIFAAAYLFTITVIHMLPELFTEADNVYVISGFILGGFLLQQVLESFSNGIEHGHFHKENKSKYGILIALTIHSLLEGSLLIHDSPFHEKFELSPLLLGIVLHKMPAAFALMLVFAKGNKLTKQQLLILTLFAFSSPLGLIISELIDLHSDVMIYLFALVSGNFLHISTTIFIESNPEHKFRWKKLAISILGAGIAFLSEYFI